MVTTEDIQLMAKSLAELTHGNGPSATKKKPFTWSEVKSHWMWLVKHAEHVKPPQCGANSAIYNKQYTKSVLSLAYALYCEHNN